MIGASDLSPEALDSNWELVRLPSSIAHKHSLALPLQLYINRKLGKTRWTAPIQNSSTKSPRKFHPGLTNEDEQALIELKDAEFLWDFVQRTNSSEVKENSFRPPVSVIIFNSSQIFICL